MFLEARRQECRFGLETLSAIVEANHYKDRAAKVDTKVVVHKAEVDYHKVIRKQLESSLKLVNKELEREKAEHTTSVACLEREGVSTFLLVYPSTQGELYRRDSSFKMYWMKFSFDLNKFLAAEKETGDESTLLDEAPSPTNPTPSTEPIWPLRLMLPTLIRPLRLLEL